MRHRSLRHSAVPLFLLGCLLLGGSPQGIWRNLALQLAAMALLVWALLARSRTHPTAAGRTLLSLALLWFAVALLQLVPLPPALWSVLPGRGPVVEGFLLRGELLPWLPLSLTPAETSAALPVMAVPLAIMAAMLWLGAYRSRWCVGALMLGALISVLLGTLQLLAGGPYLYPIANVGAPAGLFANANHQATLLLALVPFLAAVIGAERKPGRVGSREGMSRMLMAAGGLIVVLLGIALNGSLAALSLAVPVLLVSLTLALPKLGRAGGLLAMLGAVLLVGAVALQAIRGPAGDGASVTIRADIYQRTAAAIADTFPIGTGIGSYESYYPLYEEPASVDRFFVNHAHSDPLEWLLETGLPGALLLLAFLLWWLRRCLAIWRADQRDLQALAGTIASAAILGHSLVDYPLRDAAIQAVFAFSLVLMADPRSHAARAQQHSDRPARHLSLDDVAVSG